MSIKGRVKWFDTQKGYGFLKPSGGGPDVFVHYTSIKSDADFKTLEGVYEVEFDFVERDGRREAFNVVPVPQQ